MFGRLLRTVGAFFAAVLLVCAPTACSTVNPTAEPADSVFLSAPRVDFHAHLRDVEAWAQSRHAHVALALVDRESGEQVGFHENEPILTASVAKLFVAAQLAYLEASGERYFSSDDDELLSTMLSSSDDFAASALWDDLKDTDIIGSVANRYGLVDTQDPPDGLWWNTQTTAADLATFYDQLLTDRDDLGTAWTNRILNHLHSWTDVATDGYDQRFGLPAVFNSDDLVAVKQGWMCCIDAQWIHLSTGVVGPNGRYILVVEVTEDVQYEDGSWNLPDTSYVDASDDESAAHARATITGVVAALFPEGVPSPTSH